MRSSSTPSASSTRADAGGKSASRSVKDSALDRRRQRSSSRSRSADPTAARAADDAPILISTSASFPKPDIPIPPRRLEQQHDNRGDSSARNNLSSRRGTDPRRTLTVITGEQVSASSSSTFQRQTATSSSIEASRYAGERAAAILGNNSSSARKAVTRSSKALTPSSVASGSTAMTMTTTRSTENETTNRDSSRRTQENSSVTPMLYRENASLSHRAAVSDDDDDEGSNNDHDEDNADDDAGLDQQDRNKKYLARSKARNFKRDGDGGSFLSRRLGQMTNQGNGSATTAIALFQNSNFDPGKEIVSQGKQQQQNQIRHNGTPRPNGGMRPNTAASASASVTAHEQYKDTKTPRNVSSTTGTKASISSQKRSVGWKDTTTVALFSLTEESQAPSDTSGKANPFPVRGERRKRPTPNLFDDGHDYGQQQQQKEVDHADELFEEDAVIVQGEISLRQQTNRSTSDTRRDDYNDNNSNNGHNTEPEDAQDMEEDDIAVPAIQTLEEKEPAVDQIYVDAASLWNGTRVRLHPFHVQNLQSVPDKNLLGSSLPEVPCRVTLIAIRWSDPVLCYGDFVQLQVSWTDEEESTDNASGDGNYLGVVQATGQVCVLSEEQDFNNGEDMLIWQVLRGDSDTHLIRVGTSALPVSSKTFKTGPIQSGCPILLRHVATGGLLSFCSGEWHILTSSYQQEEEPSDQLLDSLLPGGHALPLNRLRDQNLMIPSLNEIFTFVLDTVPWTTAWMHGGSLSCRPYALKTYLRFPNRHYNDQEVATQGQVLSAKLVGGETLASMREQQIQTVQGQEQILVEELMGSFLGLEGTYIRVNIFDDNDSSLRGQQIQFYFDYTAQFDRGLAALVEGLLPLSNSFALVEEFVAKRIPRFEYGRVMQALCVCLETMVDDYMQSVYRIEDDYRRAGSLSLRELQSICQPLLERLSVLGMVVLTVANNKGGELINKLRQLRANRYQGNAAAETIIHELLEAASRPFMGMLQNWLADGVLEDPYQEFMIKCDANAAEWWSKYALDDQNVLKNFFPTPIEVKRVLATGKYWNAVRVCIESNLGNTGIAAPHAKDLPKFVLQFHCNGAEVASHIQKLHASASQSLVCLLMKDCDFMGTLQLLKRYFLLDQGDFFLTFMEAAEEELSRDPSQLRQFRVEQLLQMAVQIIESNINEDRFPPSPQLHLRLSPTDLTCRFAPDSLVDQLDRIHAPDGGLIPNEPVTPQRLAYTGQGHPTRNGVDLFLLDFTEIPFPLSLVLTELHFGHYSLLFRHLFFAKHVERKLVAVWRDHLAMNECTPVRGFMGPTHLLRQRMLHFVQNLIYYMNFEVIEPNFNMLTAKLSKPVAAQTVEEIMDVHKEFLDLTLEACLLTNRDLVLAFKRVMQTCLLFSKQMEIFSKKVRLHQDNNRVRLEHARDVVADDSAEFISQLHKEQYEERKRRVQNQTKRLEREVSNPGFQSMIAHYESTFDKHLCSFMTALSRSDDQYHAQRVNLCIRLDYNGFVTSSIGLRASS